MPIPDSAAPDPAAEIERLRRALAAADGYINRGHYEMARNITRAAIARAQAAGRLLDGREWNGIPGAQ